MPAERYDFVVVGSGVAGLTFALKAAANGTVAVLTKSELESSNTFYAQGGIAAAVGPADSWQTHAEDTIRAGGGLNDPEAVNTLVREGPSAIRWLQSLGARFDSADGELELGREGGHSRNRIVHSTDRTGSEIVAVLARAAKENPRIAVYEQSHVYALTMTGGRCVGAEAQLPGLGDRIFTGRAVVLATGGSGKLYLHTTNPPVATADGLALGMSVGAKVKDMEFVQFHPTTLYHPQARSFLISEAVRGAGATLRNHLGERFMYSYDERLELAPRDVVARAIESEMRRLGTWCVYLDATHLPLRAIESEFPNIYATLAELGIELHRQWIPVVPAQHYQCGGLCTDLHGQTTVEGLYAIGEVACTGVHGANRLASNSLLEGLVFAERASKSAAGLAPMEGPDEPSRAPLCVSEAHAVRIRRTLQRTMSEGAGIVRTNAGLTRAREVVAELSAEHAELQTKPFSPYAFEAYNLLMAARQVLDEAIARTRNIGLHYNSDLASEAAPNTSDTARAGGEPEPTQARRA